VIATENSRETIDGDMDIAVNATLELQPSLVGNHTTGNAIPPTHIKPPARGKGSTWWKNSGTAGRGGGGFGKRYMW
jgi:hypothetical protein